jgi:trimeric autotransporter adhesin
MFDRSCVKGLLLVGLLAPIASCGTSPSLTSIVISPTDPTITLALTSTGAALPPSDQLPTQYTALGYYTRPDHPAEVQDVTSQVTWAVNSPDLVAVSSTGLALPAVKAVGFGQITASMPGFGGDIVSNQSTYTVNLPTNFETSDVTSLDIEPASPTVTHGNPIGFSVIGTTGTGETINLTRVSTWTSSNTGVATIGARTGSGEAVAAGTSAIVVSYVNADGLEVTAYTILTVI